MHNRRAVVYALALIAAGWVGTPTAHAQAFNPGPCSGLLCGFGSDAGQPGAPKPPPNCGGLLCDTGAARAFEPPPGAAPPRDQAAEAPRAADAAAADAAKAKHRPRHRRAAKASAESELATAKSPTSPSKAAPGADASSK